MRTELLTSLLVCALLTPTPAAAQTVTTPTTTAGPRPLSDTLTGAARADYESAKLLHKDGDYQGARLKFEGAYEKSKDPRLLWNIAACEKNLRHYANVVRLVKRYQTDGAALLTQADKDEAAELLKTIEPFTAALKVTVEPPGSEVFVDDQPVGVAPLDHPATVDIGVRKVRVTKAGFKDVVKDVPVGGSPEILLDVKLEKIVHEGRLSVTASAGDVISVDGVTRGSGSWSGTLPSGGHMLRITAPEMRPYQSDVVITDNEVRTVNITLDKEVTPRTHVPAWVWVGGGVLLVGGIAAGSYALFKPEDQPATLPQGTLQPGAVQASMPWVTFR